jgi:rhodanese-related sulfurtransferase
MLPVIIIGTLAAAAVYTFSGRNLVSSKEANRLIRAGKIKKVIDVRTTSEYRAGHYKGAVHIPVNAINKKTTAGLPKKGLLVYCNTGQRARFAAEKLEKLGFEDVYYIAGHYSSLN